MSAWWAERSREEMAAEDPYEGRGVFLEAPGMKGGEMLARLAGCLGQVVPAVAWDDIGVWTDPGSGGMTVVAVRERWNGGKASDNE